ncbi:MAG: IS4 family transposase, partial [Candidatus Brocadiae bacterium]|nr:IS4 family transposase [Candidatus Brocadiia bacterium]
MGGYKFFRRVRRLLESLHHCAGHRNRRLHYDDYAALVLFYFFNPVITSLRGLQAVSGLPK